MKKIISSFTLFILAISTYSQLPNYVPTDGLVGYWPFNGNANDESGNEHHLIPGPGATLTIDRNSNFNSAYFLSTANDGGQLLFNTSDFNLIDNFQEGSISFWVKLYVHDINNHYFGWDNIFMVRHKSGVNSQLQIGLKGGTTKVRVHLNGVLPSDDQFESNEELELLSWYYLTYTWNNSVERIYVDGLLNATESNNTYITPLPAPDIFCFGSTLTGIGGETTNSSLDDIGIWNRALSEEEIQALYEGCIVVPTAIVGDDGPLNFTTSSYFCNDNPGSTYEWTVTNGVISSGQGSNNIIVLWGNEGVGTVSVVETNSEGCVGQPAVFEVAVQCSSNISMISGNTSPVILTQQNYSVNGPVESNYQWTITNGVIASGQGTNSVNVIWAAQGEGTLSVVETTSSGCESNVVSLIANALITSIEELSKNNFNLYPNPATDNIYIQCNENMIGEEYEIYDMLGREVIRGRILSTIERIDLTNIQSGLYTLRSGYLLKTFLKKDN